MKYGNGMGLAEARRVASRELRVKVGFGKYLFIHPNFSKKIVQRI